MNKTTKQRITQIFAFFGFTTKEKRDAMTNEDWNKIKAEYKKKFGVELENDLSAPEEETPPVTQDTQGTISPETQQQILGALEEVADVTGTEPPAQAPETVEAATRSFIAAMNTAIQTIRTLASQPEPDKPAAVITGTGTSMAPQAFAIVMGHAPHTGTHLFGLENDYFKRGNWWNELTATGKGREEAYRDEDAASFRAAFNSYGKDFKARCLELRASNQVGLLDFNKMVKGESYLDYSKMNAKLGEYIVRRMDMVIAYLRTLKSVSHLFPVVSGVQNKMTAPTATFAEVSQSYKAGHLFKGAVNFDGEIYHVDDVMFKFAFDDPKQLEKEYIGYMNREGSNPMKWTLFEWIIVHFGTKLFNEQQRRRVVGVSVPRQGDFPQPAMFGADGALRAIQRVEEELKVLPFDDLKVYDETTIGDYIRTFWKKVMAILPNMADYQLFVNEKHQSWYVEWFREKYGKDTDFKGVKNIIQDLSPSQINWVPNMEMVDYKMWITVPGNVENYELVPNEMYAFYFQQDLEQLIIASWWKEGAGVLAPGVQFSSPATLTASGRKLQWLFTNYPVVQLADSATTIDGTAGYEFMTVENSATTALTDILNASVERVYKVICGSLTKKTTIAKSGKFANISVAWTPNAVGDYIKLYAELTEQSQTINNKTVKVVVPTGNFLELERKISN
jgi:hypothetical protein